MGVVVHSGQTLNSGHYYSFIRERPPTDQSDPKPGRKGHRWYCFNDSSVYQFDHNKLPEETFGARDGSWKSATAYVLVYERAEPEEIGGLEEKKSLPTELLERIWHENRVKVRDNNVYNVPYFCFLKEMLNYMMEKYPNPPTACTDLQIKSVCDKPVDVYDGATRLFARFLFKTLSRSARRNIVWLRFVDGLQVLMQNNVASSVWFLSMIIHPHHNWLSELLLAPEPDVREAAAFLFSCAAETVSKLEQDAYVQQQQPTESQQVVADSKNADNAARNAARSQLEDVLSPNRGYVVQAVDRLLHFLDNKETSSLVMESLANFAAIGQAEASYLQKKNITKHLLEALTSQANASHNLADPIFSLLNTVKRDLKQHHIQILFENDFLERLLVESYTKKRATSVVSLIAYLCSEEAVVARLDTQSENIADQADQDNNNKEDNNKNQVFDCVVSRLKVVLKLILYNLEAYNYTQTRPYFRVLSGLLRPETETETETKESPDLCAKRTELVTHTILKAIDTAAFSGRLKLYRKTDFFTEHLLRMAQTHEGMCLYLCKSQPRILSELVTYFEKYPQITDAIGKLDGPLDSREPKYHMMTTKSNKPARFGITYTHSSRFAPYGRPSSEKIKALKSLVEGKSIYVSGEAEYDSDEDRQARDPDDFKKGQRLDVLDTARKWLLSEVLHVRGRLIEIHYLDYPHAWDEWIEISSPRLCLEAGSFSRLEKLYHSYHRR